MNRRDFLIAAPAATLTGSITASVATLASPAGAASPVCRTVPSSPDQTPIARLFAEWERLHALSNELGIPDDELDRRTDAEIAVEKEIRRTPAVSAQDLAQKALIDVGFGVFDSSPQFWAEVCDLAGVPVSRMCGFEDGSTA